MKWLLIPGWSTSPDIFSPYRSILTDTVDYNWGFDSSNSKSLDSDIIKKLGNEYSILCYSLGCLKALELSETISPKKIITIGGFTSFCDDNKRRKMHINLMLKGLKRNNKKTLNDFTENAQLSKPEEKSWDIPNLEKGLIQLRDGDFSAISKSSCLDILLIEGIQDAIVPSTISQKLLDGPGNRLSIQLNGGHGIIETNASEISQIISDNL